MTSLKTIAETAADFSKEASKSVEAFGRTAGKKLDRARNGTGSALHAVAGSVRTTANRLDATASYVKHHGLKDTFTELRKFAAKHPTGSLMVAVAVGFIAASALRRSDA